MLRERRTGTVTCLDDECNDIDIFSYDDEMNSVETYNEIVSTCKSCMYKINPDGTTEGDEACQNDGQSVGTETCMAEVIVSSSGDGPIWTPQAPPCEVRANWECTNYAGGNQYCNQVGSVWLSIA